MTAASSPRRPPAWVRRSRRRLQRVFCTSALFSIRRCEESRRFYDRKRAEGKRFFESKFRTRSFSNIVTDMQKAGNGARGIVWGLDEQGGHVFNVINNRG